MNEHEKLLRLLTNALQEGLGENIVSIVVFGSYARREAVKESDIDICLVLERAPSSTSERIRQILSIQKNVTKTSLFSYVVYTRKEAMKNRSLFLDMTVHSKILFDKEGFFEKRLEDLKQRLKDFGAERITLPDGTWYWDLKPDLKFGEVFEL